VSTIADDPAFAYSAIEAELSLMIGRDASADPRIAVWYAACVDWTDSWLGYDWTDADGNDVPKPAKAINLALYEGVRAMLLAGDKARGITKVATGSLSEEYGSGLDVGAVAGPSIAGMAGQWHGRPWARGLL
jgi:hypothetical protein